jgi:hypothetical protein
MGHPAAHLRSTLLVQGLDEGILSFVFASNIYKRWNLS